jgi:superfamily II DNA helicase RecQ
MPFRFFSIPMLHSAAAEAELNAFLRSHPVLEITRRWVDRGRNSYWCFCVEYLDAGAGPAPGARAVGTKTKIDYQDVLSPEEFAVFSKLRELRKQLAQEESAPVYTIFNNEQLAQMVQIKACTKADLERIASLGDARIEKYGDRVLEVLQAQWKAGDAQGRKPV